MLAQALSTAVVGSPETVKQGIDAFIRRTGADELMVTAQIFDHRGARALVRDPGRRARGVVEGGIGDAWRDCRNARLQSLRQEYCPAAPYWLTICRLALP